MKYHVKTFLLCLVSMLLLVGCTREDKISGTKIQETHADNPRSNKAELRYLVLEGSPYNRGFVHGRTLKNEIQKLVTIWKADLEIQSGMDADSFIEKFLADTNFIPSIEKWTPGLLEEVRGISDGSEIDFETILVFNLPDETGLYLSESAGGNCSGIAIGRSDKNPSFVAQNMDPESFRNGFQVLLHIKHDSTNLENFVFTCAGLIAMNGMNNKAIGVCVNALDQLKYSREGLPVAFVIRGLLEQATLEDAVAFLMDVTHASGQNYIVGNVDNVRDFEASASKVVEYIPDPAIQVIYHTNHPLVNAEYNTRYEKFLGSHEEIENYNPSSYARFRSLEIHLKRAPQGDLELIKAVLRSHDSAEYPICRPYDENKPVFTFGCTIMVLSESPELHIAPGPPDVTLFQIFRF